MTIVWSLFAWLFTAVLTLFLWILTHIWADVTIVAVFVLLMIYTTIRKGITEGGVWVAIKHAEQLHFVKCKDCDGCGVTFIGGAIIPREVRSFDSTAHGLVIREKIANTVKCAGCMGLTGFWVDKNGTKREAVQDRKLTDEWR